MPTKVRQTYPIFINACNSFDLAFGDNTKEIRKPIGDKVKVQTIPRLIPMEVRGHPGTITRLNCADGLPNGKLKFDAEAVCLGVFNTSESKRVIVEDYDIQSGYGHMSLQ